MKEVKSVVIRFSGDSGDGMQLTGTQFSNTSALMGNDISTFPDFPSEIRAPQGTVAGVSGFQVHLGSSEITTHGDEPDVLVAMNPAALKANLEAVKKGGAVIVNIDAFDLKGLQKAGYKENPLEGMALSDYNVIKANISSQTVEALKEYDLDNKSKARCKNFYALGITYFLFGRSAKNTLSWIEKKFAKNPILAEANMAALKAGRNYAETLEAVVSLYTIEKAKIKPGRYRQINGNTATAWGMIQAAKAAGLELFLGSYPITPATDILHELSHHKHFGVKTFQAEDEIAGICSAIGASFAGALALTTTSGPGLALKGEAIGLAIICEMPLVIVNVQRGGPSTGLPTKTEQSDLNQALFGRNGESPAIVVAASRPSDCFEMAFEASRLALEHMHPVILLTDGYIANGAEPWLIPDLSTSFNKINHRQITKDDKEFKSEDGVFLPYKRDDKNFSRPWAIPGTTGFEHRIGGLEREDVTGNVSHSPKNHQVMTDLRAEKIKRVQDNIPLQKLTGESSGDILVLSWGGSYGACYSAVKALQEEGKKVSLAHLRYINPMPSNLEEIIGQFKRVLVPELNSGQMRDLLNCRFQCGAVGYNKVQGLPFKISEVVDAVNRQLESL
ncbi:MAG: 2-oxoacid:acceptor oxidoreductase subunit alpha [Bdellovibrionales bacterium]|jgi:2-oxoglutarate/2-oxoacid ferredoxin oxidoreductase subunit alpha|nr:2-oxoacid:acceptor oxidoreductase subunit alpha [Bdellovibrionales bacterium]MBT3526276.1 2-oxoacid:acceptor oxidoreductase subunit alpha [Bdellovibrionales bacterium]MBT7766164.1 2-oxoacid:acceptor oxidoreductase subunit alpha [Bdellovibrionales bacterium]